MSLILDALKKSEAQRQRGQVPTLATPSVRSSGLYQEKTEPKKWLWISVALIAFAISTASVWWQQTEKSTAVAAPAAIPTSPITTSSTVIFPEEKTAEKTAEKIDAPIAKEKNVEAAPIKSAVEITLPPLKKPTASTNITTFSDPPKQAITEAPTSISPAIETSSAPYLSTMTNDLRKQLPAMKLSMHVYTNEPSKRFAIIDGQRVNEGSTVGNAIIERINTEGVIVSVQGQSYLVPRP
jgi:general secretion pathway protein B